MTKKIIYISMLMLSFLSCKTDTKSKREYLEKSKTKKITSLANRYLELNRFSGVIFVAKGDTLFYNSSFGLADYENKIPFSNKSAFKIGEISELVTASIIRNMAIRDKFQLTDKISKYITEIKSDLTINDVLNHKPNFAIESSDKHERNDLDYNSLGLLIEKISGKSFQENIEEYSKDLGLENTYFQKVDSTLAIGYLYHNYQGNGLELQRSPVSNLENIFSSNGLKSTAKDLAKVINSNSENELAIDGYLENDGFSYSIVNNPKIKLAIIVLSNRRHPISDEISNSINAIIQDKAYRLPLARKPFIIKPDLLNDYHGKYVLNKNVTFEVLNENDSLFVLLGSNKVSLIPQSENQFYMIDMDASMRFVRDSTEKVTQVVLLNGFVNSQERATKLE